MNETVNLMITRRSVRKFKSYEMTSTGGQLYL